MRVLFLLLLIFAACKTNKSVSEKTVDKMPKVEPSFVPGPAALVYKTKADYQNLVPVILSEDKSAIVAYPHPDDLKFDGKLRSPLLLKDGYLLDNKGINKNVAFIKLTYKEYAQLKSVPELKELYAMIVDKDPLTELCDCGNRNAYNNISEQINQLITDNNLKKRCKILK